MFLYPGLEQVDPALLAFVKCHVTSATKWEVLRTLANQDGAWVSAEQLAMITHRPAHEVIAALTDLTSDSVVDTQRSESDALSYRLCADEPTSIVLHRLIEATTHSQELRAIIAAHLQHERQLHAHGPLPASTAAA
jgi:hypothetical protein